MLLCIVVYVFFKYLNYYITPVGQMVFTAYSQWHKIWIGNVLPVYGTYIEDWNFVRLNLDFIHIIVYNI